MKTDVMRLTLLACHDEDGYLVGSGRDRSISYWFTPSDGYRMAVSIERIHSGRVLIQIFWLNHYFDQLTDMKVLRRNPSKALTKTLTEHWRRRWSAKWDEDLRTTD